MDRHRALAATALLLLVAGSGCLGPLAGGTTSFEASPVSVPGTTLDETGYELTVNETQAIDENVTVLGQERTISVVNYLRQYRKTISIPILGDVDLARFAVLSTPQAEVAGQSANPVAQLSTADLVTRYSDRVGGVENLTRVNNRTVRSLGESRTVEKFTGTVERDGQRIEVFVHATVFEHDGDHVVAVGVHPRELGDEQDAIDELLRSLRH